ncbi:hypothetical protein QFC22_003290 [Naganishia vaughanmartiniae]|uniref:Uncharacterized protein n=1 Tax=Naganishia vaughanmartiniae TaxID=1424756 RepID=A0ACC2X814_9TREE|nr:hypothetical protein QFC22_003290 [Naganishia vaughanmartiniae]
MATHRPSRYSSAPAVREESPEIQVLSPPIQTQELPSTAGVPRPRARRRGQNIAEEQSQSARPAVVIAPKQPQHQQQPIATPARRQPTNGINGSASSSARQPAAVQSVYDRTSDQPTDVGSSSKQQVKEQQLHPESSPLKELLPRRARIRHSLMPQDQSGRFTVRAGVMEERVRMISTVAQDAILTSMQFELDEMGEGRETWSYLTEVWDLLDSNQTYVFNFERAPLFLTPETVAEDLKLEGAGHVDLFEAVPSLALALALRNLASFWRIMLGPDETVQRLLPENSETTGADHTKKLSILFGHAWNALLRICVPRSKWTSRAAVGLLVDMATQRFIMGYGRWSEFEQLDDAAVNELNGILSADAIRNSPYGNKELWGDGESDESLENLEHEWQRAIKIRLDTILAATPRELDYLFPFNAFRHELAVQVYLFLQGSEPLEGFLPEEHEALGAAIRERRNANAIESQEADDVSEDSIVEDDDAAVDLLTQTQHVSGRSEQDQHVNMESQQSQSQQQTVETLADNTFPESIEMYETQANGPNIVGEDEVGPSNAEKQEDELSNAYEAAQNDDDELENEADEPVEEEEEQEEQEEQEELETVETQPMAVEDNVPDQEETAESAENDVEVVIDLEADETLETQQSWNIRKGRNGPVTAGNIVREAADASRGVQKRTNRLNAPQTDAVRLGWDDSQQPTQGEGEEPVSSGDEEGVPQPVKKKVRKRATPSPTPDASEPSEDEEVTEKETKKQRQIRKGKAPVRPVRKAAGATRHAVESSKRLVSEDESTATQGSDYEEDSETDEEEAPANNKFKDKVSQTVSKPVPGRSRTDVPAVRRTVKPANKQRAETTPALADRKQTRYGQNVSFMDHYVDNDLFMVDEDGEPLFDEDGHPLKEDPDYVRAVPNHPRSAIPKGYKERPRLVWTEDDKLLLYREISKCPIDAKSSYVSEVLHRFKDWDCPRGSDVFRLADSMKLRDQMRDLVKLRSDRDLPKKGELTPEEEQQRFADDVRREAEAEKNKRKEKSAPKLTRKKRKRQATVVEEEEEEEEGAEEDRRDVMEVDEEEPEAEPACGSRLTQQSQAEEELDELEIEKEIGVEAADETASDIREEAGDKEANQPIQDDPGEAVNGNAVQVEEPASPEPAQKKQRVLRSRNKAKK